MPAPLDADGRPAARPGMWSEIRAGSREVRARKWVWATLFSFCAALFFGLAPWFVLGPLVAKGQYGHVSVYGILEATIGLGTIVGALIGIGWRPRFPMRAAMIAITAWPVAAILYASGVTLFVVLPVTLVAGTGIAVFDILWTTALAERIPPASLSRVSSYDWMISGGLLPLGYALAGPLAEALGAVEVMLGGSCLALVAFGFGLAPRETRMLERLGARGHGGALGGAAAEPDPPSLRRRLWAPPSRPPPAPRPSPRRTSDPRRRACERPARGACRPSGG